MFAYVSSVMEISTEEASWWEWVCITNLVSWDRLCMCTSTQQLGSRVVCVPS